MDLKTLNLPWTDDLVKALRTRFEKLTDVDFKAINGNMDMLYTKLVERYGWTRQDAERHVGDVLKPFLPKQS